MKSKTAILQKNTMDYKVDVVINKDENGYFAYCPALEGCVTQGNNYEETIEHVKEAVSLYLSTMSEEEIKATLSKEILTTSINIQVA